MQKIRNMAFFKLFSRLTICKCPYNYQNKWPKPHTSYRVLRYLRPPFPHQTRHRYIPKLYIFMTLYQFQITMQVFMTIALLTYFWSHGLGRVHFHGWFLPVFLGWLSKNPHKIINNWLRPLYNTPFKSSVPIIHICIQELILTILYVFRSIRNIFDWWSCVTY